MIVVMHLLEVKEKGTCGCFWSACVGIGVHEHLHACICVCMSVWDSLMHTVEVCVCMLHTVKVCVVCLLLGVSNTNHAKQAFRRAELNTHTHTQ